MYNPLLAKDYEVPKKSMFRLEGMDLVQNRDATAYISNSVTDSVMYGTNGNLGLRHRSEIETIGFRTGVMLSGVYHTRPRESMIRCTALPTEYHTGASICFVDLDCRIDGESGTLSSVPARRMGLEDAAYHSHCEDVMSSDGQVMFDAHYTRAVSCTDLSAWGAEATYNNFRVVSDRASGSDRGTAVGDESLGNQWSGYGHLNPSLDSNDYRVTGGPVTPHPYSPESWRMEFVVTFAVDLDDWEVLKADQMDEVWQRSLTSNILVNSNTDVSLTVHYTGGAENAMDTYANSNVSSNGPMSLATMSSAPILAPTATGGAAGSTTSGGGGPYSRRLVPEVTIIKCDEDADLVASPLSIHRYGNPSPFLADARYGDVPGDDTAGASSGRGGDNSRSNGSAMDGAAYGDRYTTFSQSGPGSPTRANATRRFLIRKSFVYTLTQDTVPKSFVLTFKGRHTAGNNNGTPIPRAVFPAISDMIAERRKSLEAFWKTHQLDLQLQEELIPNRTKLALMYNAFVLFNVHYGLEGGLSRSGCSCPGDALQCDLGQYVHHGIYYVLTDPPSCLVLLKFLYSLLPQARVNARQLSIPQGAMYPECTITGVNTKFYTNIMDARFHINADVGFLIHLYNFAVESITREDRRMLLEMMLETARIWISLGDWRKDKTEFLLDNLAGPDEYNANGNSNFYILLSAKKHMERAVAMVDTEERILGVDDVSRLLARISMTREELLSMKAAAAAIVLKRSEDVGAYMVHENFDTLTPWDGGERAKHPLSLNYHPLAIFRQKVVDIPEVLLGMIMHESTFDSEDFERNLAYYAPLCTLDTPESMSVLATALCRARANFAQPIPLLRSLLHLDLDNITYLAEEGLHFGAMSSGMLAFLLGIGGVSFHSQCLRMNPLLPAGVNRYCFTVCWRGAVLKTTLDTNTISYELISGDSIRFIHGTGMNRIHLHTGFRRCEATRALSIPRRNFTQAGQFDGAIFLSDCLFENLLEYSYVSWYRTLEPLFENYRMLHQRLIPPLTPEEFIAKVVYQTEAQEIAFSGIHNVLLDRGVNLDLGTPDDAEIVETRYGLANAKVAEMAELLIQRPPPVNPDLFNLIRGLAHSGVACAIVTYSRSLKQLMQHSAELSDFFVARIDGEEAHDRSIKGRPHLDLYLKAAEKIHVEPSRCITVAHHLDKNFTAEQFAGFRMFLDIDDPFVSSRVPPAPYPSLDAEASALLKRDNPVVCRLALNKIPRTIDELEDIIEGRPIKDRVAPP